MKHTDLLPSPDWSRALTSTLAFVERRGDRILGLVSAAPGGGASLIGHELAAACRSFGRRPFLFDPMTAARQAGPADGDGLPDMVSGLQAEFRSIIDEIVANHDLVIVDLPPLSEGGRQRRSVFIAAGGICDLVLLVCETGTMSRADLKRCLDVAKVCGVEPVGIVLNDRKLPMSRLLVD